MASSDNRVTVSFDSESRRKIDQFTKSIEKAVKALEKLNQIGHIPEIPPVRYEQEPNIMYTVVDALGRSGLTEEQARVAVGEMQQAGVIFVENEPRQ